MPDIELMELWLDKRKLAALEKSMEDQNTSVEERMLGFFQQLYDEAVPLPVREEIERQIHEEKARVAAEAESHIKHTAYRVTRDDQCHCFQTNTGSDILMTALRLSRYLSDPTAGGFETMLPDRLEISEEAFSQLAMLRLDGSSQIVGVFDLDFDRGEFSSVDPAHGWRTFPMSAACSAFDRAEKKQGLSHEQRRVLLLKNLEGWAVPFPGHLPLDAVIFDGKIDVLPGRLSFQLDPEAWFDSLDAVFGTNTCTEDNNDFLTVCACYDSRKHEVCGGLDVIWHREEGSAERLTYPLNDVERSCVGRRMEEYCRQQTDMKLATYGAQAEQSYFAPHVEPLTDFEAMALYAEMCVAEMADRICGELQRSAQQIPETDATDQTAEAGQERNTGPVMGGMQ